MIATLRATVNAGVRTRGFKARFAKTGHTLTMKQDQPAAPFFTAGRRRYELGPDRRAIRQVVFALEKWWWKIRYSVRAVIFPLICVQFVRTLLLPTALDVFILFALFLVYVGFLLNVY
mgnify:CR=1 FL=1